MSTGSLLIYISCAVAAIIGIGAVVIAATPWRLHWVKSTESAKTRWQKAPTVLLAVCGVLVAGGAGLGATVGAPSPTPTPSASPSPGSQSAPTSTGIMVQFTSPKDVLGQSLPTMGCSLNVTGTGSIPGGDVLVIGSVVRGGNGSFQPLQATVQWANAASWHTTLDFSNARDAGHTYDIKAVVMPEAWKDYLLSEALYYNAQAGETWWASGEPPVPAEVAASVAVMRIPVPQSQCA
jgi:hypothetical protein